LVLDILEIEALQLAYNGAYDAPQVDVWGAGIILFTLLVGSTPWDEATVSSSEFMSYVNGSIWSQDPWSRIRKNAKSADLTVADLNSDPLPDLLCTLLAPNPAERPSIETVRDHPWFSRYGHPPYHYLLLKVCRQSQFATQSAADVAHHLTKSLRDTGDMDIVQPDAFTE